MDEEINNSLTHNKSSNDLDPLDSSFDKQKL